MIPRQIRACSYASSGGSASPGMIGAVPDTQTVRPDADGARVADAFFERCS